MKTVAVLAGILLFGAGAVEAAAPPPVLLSPPPEPARPEPARAVSSPATGGGETALPIRRVAVTLHLGKEVLWSGVLHIGGRTDTNLSLAEPLDMPVAACAGTGRFAMPVRRITLSIASNRYGDRAERYRLNAQYARPGGRADGEDACIEPGQRTVSLQYSFDWNDGEQRIFDGDGGFRVTIAGRK